MGERKSHTHSNQTDDRLKRQDIGISSEHIVQ